MKPSLIGTCGNKFGAGKDTVVLRLTDYGYKPYSFGRLLKLEVQAVLTDPDFRDRIWDEMPEVLRNALLVCLSFGQLDPFAKPTTPEMRLVLQFYGTEFRRNQDPDYWVKALDRDLIIDNPRYACITDVRFPNEFDYVHRYGNGETWYVVRPDDAYDYTSSPMSKHASEGQLEGLNHDFRLLNNSTIAQLWSLVDRRMEEYSRAPWLAPGTGDPSGQAQRPQV